jgi:hypothetical protein
VAGGSQGRARSRAGTNQCHDITVFPELGLAAGACAGNGILLDISDPVHPVRLDAVTDKNFAYWHSATFNNDGTKVIFTDEWGGGTRPRCRATIRRPGAPTRSSTSSIASCSSAATTRCRRRRPIRRTASRTTGRSSRCRARHHGAGVVPGRLSVFDFTDSTKPVEIAYFDRGPLDASS